MKLLSISAPGTESSSETGTQSQSTNNQVKDLGVSWVTSAKIFDPLGVLSPFVIKLKSFFQQLCVEKVDWDEDLQGQLCLKYRSLLSELSSCKERVKS